MKKGTITRVEFWYGAAFRLHERLEERFQLPADVETLRRLHSLFRASYQTTDLREVISRASEARTRLWAQTAAWDGPVVAFESPKRLPSSLASLAAASPERPVAVCRELTKRFDGVELSAAELVVSEAEWAAADGGERGGEYGGLRVALGVRRAEE
mgnify:CR=1 FL=1